jgi:hypothetical protein
MPEYNINIEDSDEIDVKDILLFFNIFQPELKNFDPEIVVKDTNLKNLLAKEGKQFNEQNVINLIDIFYRLSRLRITLQDKDKYLCLHMLSFIYYNENDRFIYVVHKKLFNIYLKEIEKYGKINFGVSLFDSEQ